MKYILIVDDHEVVRRGIRGILADALPEVVVREAVDGTSALKALADGPCDLVLLDITMPGPGILEVLARIRALRPAPAVLVLTAATEPAYIIETMRAGASGFIHKYRASDELLDAIQKVAGGGTYLHPESATAVAQALREPRPALLHDRLSEREMEILRGIARGRAVKEVAADLGISDKTVATYLGRIREKTGLASHVEIARYALQHGLVD